MKQSLKTVGKKVRAERVSVRHLENVELRINLNGETWQKAKIVNVSSTGIGLLPDDFKFSQSQVFSIELKLGDHQLSLQVEVRHLTEEICGCQFVNMNEADEKQLEKFFRAEILGAKLSLVSENSGVYFFSDGFGAQFTCSFINERLNSFRFGIWGNVIDFSRQQLRVGEYLDYTEEDFRSPQLIAYFEKDEPKLREFAKQLLTQLLELTEAQKDQIHQALIDAS